MLNLVSDKALHADSRSCTDMDEMLVSLSVILSAAFISFADLFGGKELVYLRMENQVIY